MEYRKLGNSDLKASEVGLGGDTFGHYVNEPGTVAIVDHALEAGINFIDTADVYGFGQSEELLGKALQGKRDKFIVATKFGIAIGKPPNPFDTPPGLGSREYIMKAVDASLKRLRTDYIDLYQFHMPDPATPIEETLRALDELVRSGKVRYIGCSNFASWELCEAMWVSQAAGISSFVSVQPKYNLLDRYIEQELVPCCTAYNIGVIPWFPLASGFLTGKYKRGEPPPAGTRFGSNPEFYSRMITDDQFDILEQLQAFAEERGHTMVELAIAWLVSHPWMGPVIAGVTRTEQITANVKAAAWKLTDDEMKQLDQAYGFEMYSLRPEIYRRWDLPDVYLRMS
jgi:aryl-alcohol dehydrogenase-like predicted oxidoreductase